VKRRGFLWDELVSFPNLLRAALQARRGKRSRPNVEAFHFDLERELLRLRDELAGGTYRPGPYRTFTIREPKPRLISAAPYRDRVVHHALVNVLEPIFERSFLHDSYACRQGKGTHAAVRRCRELARRYRYAWKADIRKFFPSIDHEVLKGLLARKVKGPRVLALAGLIIDHSNPQEEAGAYFAGDDLFTPARRRRGLPIGNQTSQFFGNVVLDPLDHFVKDRLGVGGYLRYCDDFVAFADGPRPLAELRRRVADFLAGLRLRLHPAKDQVFPTRQGTPFLGYRVFRTHLGLAKANVFRFRRRLRRLQRLYAGRRIDWSDVVPRVVSWLGHAGQADTFGLRERLLAEHPFRRAAAE
jgi:hypothetical protein